MADEKTQNDSPVQVFENKDRERQGQAQVKEPYTPHDGKHAVHEVVVVTDKVITDANSELAVQIPEGVGASTVGHYSPLGEALKRGSVQEQMDADQSDADKSAKAEADRAKKS
jgi:hypothetical protein